MCLQFAFVIFWQKEISAKAACKILVKLTHRTKEGCDIFCLFAKRFLSKRIHLTLELLCLAENVTFTSITEEKVLSIKKTVRSFESTIFGFFKFCKSPSLIFFLFFLFCNVIYKKLFPHKN